MEAVVHQALGHVLLGDSSQRLERAQIEDALWATRSLRPRYNTGNAPSSW